jgi:serine/threonine-protein kinase
VVHRDIKPDNILIDAESGRPMVTDFGIARAVSDGNSRLTATGIAIGTPTYMSPEQAAGERDIDGRSDLYSLGIVGYQMLTGEPPFLANSTPAILVKHISERPTPIEQRRADVPADLSRVIMLLLEKDPANRFPSAGAVVVALDTGRVPDRLPTGSLPAAASQMAPSYATADAVDQSGARAPTPEEWRRWEAEPVARFRRKVATYLYVNGVILLAAIVTQSSDLASITVIWSIYLAFKYARLWSDGYDWRDVFRQPRDRELVDVADDFVTGARALFDRKQRQALREQRRARLIATRGRAALSPGSSSVGSASDVALVAGAYADRVHRAESDRAEVLRLLQRMPAAERSHIPDVSRSADALAEKVKSLAVALAEMDRSGASSGATAIEAEITRLENAANPLDERGSDERVRKLAKLKRERRAYADGSSRREAIAAKLETCLVALQNIKLDLIRLSAGSQTPQHVTTLAMDALNLADSVDAALYVGDEQRAAGARSAGRPAAR